MTLVQFDEPALHVDTDAAGEPCVVASDARTPGALYVARELGAAYDTDATCHVCNERIETVAEAAYLFSAHRVAHAERCLATYLIQHFGFRGPRVRAILQTVRGTLHSEPAVGALEPELVKLAERACTRIETAYYSALAVPRNLGAAARAAFEASALDAIALGAPNLILDCAPCVHLDASGFGALVKIRRAFDDAREAGAPGGRIVLIGVHPDVRELLALTRIDTLVTIVDTIADAEALIAQESGR